MNFVEIAHTLQLIAVLVTAALTFFWMIPAIFVDKYRNVLFHLRSSLFDYAADGHISFDSKQYKLLRFQMNALLYISGEMTWPQLVMLNIGRRIGGKKPLTQWKNSWDEALQEIDNKAVRRRMQDFHETSVLTAAKLIFCRSYVLLAAAAIFAFCLWMKEQTARRARFVLDWRMACKTIVKGRAIDKGLLEQEALRRAMASGIFKHENPWVYHH